MLKSYEQLINFYENTNEFIAAIEYTSGRFGFRDTLVEKDFLCSMILMFLYKNSKLPLCFKGGTLLAKVHAGFYRLSEDLDFSIAMPVNAKRKERSILAKPCKLLINDIPQHLPFNLAKPLAGTNESKQYNAVLIYQSKVSGGNERILIEIGLREPHLIQPSSYRARTLLSNPFSGNAIVSQFEVKSLTQQEAYAEKIRAALTRQKLAIRDFYDISYAIDHNLIDLCNSDFIRLVEKKLSILNYGLVNFDNEKIMYLMNKVNAELQPTLIQRNSFNFKLESIVQTLQYFSKKLNI